jgi:hypothetical protein
MLPKNFSCTMLVLLLFSVTVSADSGMWMPHQISDNQIRDAGLNLSAMQIFNTNGMALVNTIVKLGGGTGSFVSSQGLVLTNHHVVYSYLQKVSDESRDYLHDGFMARNMTEEIPAPGLYADVLLGYKEITDQINDFLTPDMNSEQRIAALEQAEKEIIFRTEQQAPDLRATIRQIYGGRNYYLYTFKRLKDIRIVVSPPLDIANFGGEQDNWMWPRHTGDFAFLRAYVSLENQGIEYSMENRPYHPDTFLQISLDGIHEGDASFVMGYPGKTYRNYTFSEFELEVNRLKQKINSYATIVDFFSEACRKNQQIELRYTSKIRSLNNAIKNYRGKLEGFEKFNISYLKKVQHQQLIQWIDQNVSRKNKYDWVLKRLDSLVSSKNEIQKKYEHLASWVNPYQGPWLLYQAHLIYRKVLEAEKPDTERDMDFQERNYPQLENKIKLGDRSYDLDTDKSYFKMRLSHPINTSMNNDPSWIFSVFKTEENNNNSYVDSIYANSQLADSRNRLACLNMSYGELRETDDPLINIAASIETELAVIRKERDILQQKENDLKIASYDALLELRQEKMAPDANSTIRITFGRIHGYSPQDGVYYLPQTTLAGVIAKNLGVSPFRVPEKLMHLSEKKDFGMYRDDELDDIPVCFLNTTNVTGGNSGSPTLNSQGKITGVIFDMTYESIIGDYYIIPQYQRTISVDIRYILFLTDKFSGAGYLIRELGLQK